MIVKMRNWYQQRRRRNMLAGMRASMKMFGHDTSDLSDDELEAKLREMNVQLAEGLKAVSVSAGQAALMLERVAHAAQTVDSALRKANI